MRIVWKRRSSGDRSGRLVRNAAMESLQKSIENLLCMNNKIDLFAKISQSEKAVKEERRKHSVLDLLDWSI